ncbi:MAG: hypothetical protein Q7S65_04465 [Nanoarchaeota archaeon]|nr:hypothetical protein [Nanoarchaeota archaeon]
MDRKHSDVLFVVLLLAAVAMTALASQFYDRYLGSQNTDTFTVADYLTLASHSPQSHLIVTGTLATDAELQAANKLSERFGIGVKDEALVESRSGLLLIGNPSTNLLLERFLREEYSSDAATVAVVEENLLIIVSSPEQAERAVSILSNFQQEPVLLSPKASLGIAKVAILSFLLALLLVPAILVLVESHRKRGIAQATESTDDHKIAAIAAYARKYEGQGFSEPQIRSWLEKYGYDSTLVEIALRRA